MQPSAPRPSADEAATLRYLPWQQQQLLQQKQQRVRLQRQLQSQSQQRHWLRLMGATPRGGSRTCTCGSG